MNKSNNIKRLSTFFQNTNKINITESNKITLLSPQKKKMNYEEIIIKSLIKELENNLNNGKKINKIKLSNKQIKIYIEYILNKKEISNKEYLLIAYYLTKYKNIIKSITKEEISNDPKDTLLLIAKNLFLCNKPKDSILFRMGQNGDLFYLIIKGSVNVYVKQEYKCYMSKYEYFKHLQYLKSIKENELVKIILEKNKDIFNKNILEECSVRDLNYYFLSIEIENDCLIHKNKFKNLKFIPPEDYIDSTIAYMNFSKDNKNNYNNKENNKFNNINFFKEFDIEDNNKTNLRKEVTLYTYYNVINLKEGDTFGEIALNGINNSYKRTATIICNENCLFGLIDNKIYNKCIKFAQNKLRNEHIALFLNFDLFKFINIELFERNFFNLFILNNKEQGFYLFNQNNKRKEIFIIKNGNFEVSCNISINELNEIIKNFNDNKNVKEKLGEIQYNGNKLNIYNEKKEQKNFIRIFNINNKEIIGLDDYIYLNSNHYFCSMKVISNYCEYYSIDYEQFLNICKNVKRVKINYPLYIKDKINFMKNRLINIRDNLIKNIIYDIQNIKIKNYIPELKNLNDNNENRKNNYLNLNKKQINFNLSKEKNISVIKPKKIQIKKNKFMFKNKLTKNNFTSRNLDVFPFSKKKYVLNSNYQSQAIKINNNTNNNFTNYNSTNQSLNISKYQKNNLTDYYFDITIEALSNNFSNKKLINNSVYKNKTKPKINLINSIENNKIIKIIRPFSSRNNLKDSKEKIIFENFIKDTFQKKRFNNKKDNNNNEKNIDPLIFDKIIENIENNKKYNKFNKRNKSAKVYRLKK